MEKNLELAIDLAAVTMICEMYPSQIDAEMVSNLINKIVSQVSEQPSAEMLINALINKHNVEKEHVDFYLADYEFE